MSKNNTQPEYTNFTGQYINGKWQDGEAGDVLQVRDPYDDSLLSEISMANEADLNAAFAAAKEAQKAWAQTLPTERAEVFLRARMIMDKRKNEIINWLIRESGSTITKAEVEFSAVRGGMLEAASMPAHMRGQIIPIDVHGKEARVYRKPVGVIGVVSPWNMPLTLSNRSVAPAMALGNAVVLKPSSDTPISGGLLLAKIYEESGLPAGVLNVIIGAGSVIGDAFSQHPTPRVISFTGSTAVGRRIGVLAAQSSHLKRLGLELGGNAPFVVLDDADLDAAVDAAVLGRFLHQGQICMSTNRIIVDEKLYPKFTEMFVEGARSLKAGDPRDPKTIIGPLCNDAQVLSVLKSIEIARAEGNRECLSGDVEGRVVPAHVFADVSNNSPFAQAEIFGPVAPLICAKDEAEALQMANDTQYGLSSSVFTSNEARGLKFALGIEVGMTHINDMTAHDYPHVMFGGEKNSGIGRFNGEWVIEEFTTDQFISFQR